MSIALVEISPNLKKKQEENISHPRVEWYQSFDDIPEGFSIIVANEFFDALPINQYVKKKDKWFMNMVDLNEDQSHLCLNYYDIDDSLRTFLTSEFSYIPDDGVIEIGDEGNILIKKITEKTLKHGGGSLIIDYGYTNDKNRSYISTLQSVKNHKFHPIFSDIGSADISSHVNFSTLADTARIHGAHTYGPITQRQFLLNMHAEVRKDILLKNCANKEQTDEILSGYQRLIDENQMGTLFKAMAVTNKLMKDIGF